MKERYTKGGAVECCSVSHAHRLDLRRTRHAESGVVSRQPNSDGNCLPLVVGASVATGGCDRQSGSLSERDG